jgi:Fe-S-cluster-containing dehydrogenase component
MKVFAIDLSICNGCYCCQIACKDEHVGNDWTPMPNPSRTPGSSGSGLKELVRGQVPKVKDHLYDQYVPPLRQRALHRRLPLRRDL